jgi:hypothetical protein
MWLLLGPMFWRNISPPFFHPDNGGNTFLQNVGSNEPHGVIPENGILQQ